MRDLQKTAGRIAAVIFRQFLRAEAGERDWMKVKSDGQVY